MNDEIEERHIARTVGELRALLHMLDGVPDETPLWIGFDSDFGSSEALEIYGPSENHGRFELSISEGQ